MSKHSKLTLVVDGNWLLMSRFSAIYSRYANDEETMKELKVLMIKSINLVLRTFQSIDNVIFVADGGSWRTDLERPSFILEDYKENRSRDRDESLPWELVFSTYEEFIQTIEDSGITVCREPGIEGDDWCWWWSNYLNSQGTNVIIWSRDKDLTQLVKTDKDGCFTVCWNKDSGVTTVNKDEEEMDFFFNMEYTENDSLFKEIVDKSVDVKKINPREIVIDKIVRGDAGDNIFPILLRNSKSASGKKFKVSQKDLDFDLNIFDTDKVREYISSILSSNSYKGRVDKSEDQILEHFIYNRKLVYLDSTSYPDNILEVFNTSYMNIEPSKDLSEAEEKITAERYSLSSVMDLI